MYFNQLKRVAPQALVEKKSKKKQNAEISLKIQLSLLIFWNFFEKKE